MKIIDRKTLIVHVMMAWIVILLLLSGCATSRNTDHDTSVEQTEDLRRMQSRMDSLMLNMRMIRKETTERLSNLKVENKTVYLSIPDSTGHQYTTAISETKADREDKETGIYDTEVNLSIQQLSKEISDLKRQLETFISEKEEEVEISWWDLHKDKVYCCIIGLLIVGWLVYRLRKK